MLTIYEGARSRSSSRFIIQKLYVDCHTKFTVLYNLYRYPNWATILFYEEVVVNFKFKFKNYSGYFHKFYRFIHSHNKLNVISQGQGKQFMTPIGAVFDA